MKVESLKYPALFAALIVLVSSCGGDEVGSSSDRAPARKESFTLKSPAFADGDTIPMKYTCDGDDVSPPLKWEKPPAGTHSFVLICEDPDAPLGTWVHWVLFNIPANIRSLPENFSMPRNNIKDSRPGIIVEGINDFRQLGYGGPCPPAGPFHRYFFKLYALNTALALKTGALKSDVEAAMKDHVLAEAVIIGKYSRASVSVK